MVRLSTFDSPFKIIMIAVSFKVLSDKFSCKSRKYRPLLNPPNLQWASKDRACQNRAAIEILEKVPIFSSMLQDSRTTCARVRSPAKMLLSSRLPPSTRKPTSIISPPFSPSDSPFRKQPLLVFDGESFWHVLHGSNLPKLFGGQFIQVILRRISLIK